MDNVERKIRRLAIEAMQREIRRLSFLASLHDSYGLDTPSATAASNKVKDLREAIRILKGGAI